MAHSSRRFVPLNAEGPAPNISPTGIPSGPLAVSGRIPRDRQALEPPSRSRNPAVSATCLSGSSRSEASVSRARSPGTPVAWTGHGRRPETHLRRGAADLGGGRGDSRPHRAQPGGRGRGCHRVGQDDSAAEDRTARRTQAHRPYPAAAHRGAHGRRADRAGDGHRAGPGRRLPGAVHPQGDPGHPGEADDRRHPARRDLPRPRPPCL